MRYFNVRGDHFQEAETEAVNIILACLLLTFKDDGEVNLWFLTIVKRDFSLSNISYLDVAIIRIDVNGFTRKLSMNQIILVQKVKALQNLEAPVLDHDESR